MKNSIRLIIATLIYFYSLSAYGSCSDFGAVGLGPYTCESGAATWDSLCIDSSPASLWTEGSGQCACGASDPAGPCVGCGYLSAYSNTNCYSNSSCTTPCTPTDEPPIHFQLGIVLGATLIALFCLRRSKSSA